MTIKDRIGSIRYRFKGLAALEEQLAADTMHTDVWKKSAKADHLKQAEDMVRFDTKKLLGEIREQFGDLDPDNVGELWRELDAAKADVRQAADAADTMNPLQVQNSITALPSVIRRTDGQLAALRAWYDKATSVERRALQLTGAEHLRGRWSAEDGIGSFEADLERDYKASLQTPAVKAAQARAQQADADMTEVVALVKHAARTFPGNDPGMFGVGATGHYGTLLSRIRRGEDGWQKVNPYPKVVADDWTPEPELEPIVPETHQQALERIYSGGHAGGLG